MLELNATHFNPDVLYVFDGFLQDESTTALHYHEFLEISVVLDGKATYRLDDKLYEVSQGDMIIINPYVLHSEIQIEGSSTHLHIGLDQTQFKGYASNQFPLVNPVLKHSSYPEIKKIISGIIQEKEYQDSYQRLALQQCITQLWVYLLREIAKGRLRIYELTEKNTSSKKELADRIKQYLDEHHSENISLGSLSSSMYVSPTYVSKLFKEEIGESPINYLIKVRMENAKKLLKDKDITVKEIANTVGYEDAYHFSKLFKKYTGVSPKEFKK